MRAAPGSAASPPWPSTCRRRTGRTAQWTPAKLIAWGERIGAATAGVVRWQMEHRPHPEQGYRSCLGLMRLARQYGHERLEAACARAQSIRAPNYRSVKSILACGLDRQDTDLLGGEPPHRMPSHDNVRGARLLRPPLMATTPDRPPPRPHHTERTPRPCCNNTPWTNCAACAWTA
jgi:transposase